MEWQGMWWPFSCCSDGDVDDVSEGNGGGFEPQVNARARSRPEKRAQAHELHYQSERSSGAVNREIVKLVHVECGGQEAKARPGVQLTR